MGGVREPTDREVIARCRAGKAGAARAFRVVYERYADEVFGYVRALLIDEALAEDALQEAFVRLYRKLDRYDPGRPLKPYLMRLAHNAAVDLLRSRKAPARRIGEVAGPDRVRADAERHELEDQMEKALQGLDPEPRAILILRHVQELKLREIAAVLAITERTARNRLRAAALLLEAELKRCGLAPAEVNS